jgi:hypothetical protein
MPLNSRCAALRVEADAAGNADGGEKIALDIDLMMRLEISMELGCFIMILTCVKFTLVYTKVVSESDMVGFMRYWFTARRRGSTPSYLSMDLCVAR